MNKKKVVIWSVVAVGLVAVAMWGARWQAGQSATSPAPQASRADAAGGGGAAAGAPIAVEVATVKAMSLSDDLQAVGTVRASESVVVRPEISGRVALINFREGQRVKRGDVLVALDDSVPRAELAQAEAQLALAQSNFDRTQDLARQNFVSASARDQAASTLKVQEAARELARTKLAKSAIRAPFDGVVGVRAIALGDYVKEGQDMVTLDDTQVVKVDFRIPERFLAQVRGGQRLSAQTDALPGKQFEAQVEFIDPQIDASNRTVLVRGRVANPAGALRPGMFARVRLVFEERADALVVPEEAIVPGLKGGQKQTVYRVVGAGDALKAVRTEVETGLRREGWVELRSGVAVGDRVVSAGQIKLRGNDVPVRVAKAGA